MPDALAVVRQAAESKPDDPIYRLVLAMTKDTQCDNGGPCTAYPWYRCSIHTALDECAREIEAAE